MSNKYVHHTRGRKVREQTTMNRLGRRVRIHVVPTLPDVEKVEHVAKEIKGLLTS